VRFGLWRLIAAAAFILTACSQETIEEASPSVNPATGVNPQIFVGDVDPADKAALSAWIKEAVELLKSPAFEKNFNRASAAFPAVYVSKTEDIIPSALLLQRLKTEDPLRAGLSWPETYVVLHGKAAVREPDRSGFGFKGSRKAAAGPNPQEPAPQSTGQIEIGRLHLARYIHGDAVEKSCALNTIAHEISHTLSETPDKYWMHILDSQRGSNPPRGVFEASYFVGVVAQCTYLETNGRITASAFNNCLLTFSDPSQSSRFRSAACDEFPSGKPITPDGRLSP